MTVTIGSGAVLIYRGFRLSLVQAKPDWCLFLIPPGDQPEVLMAESRASAIAEAQRLIDDRLAKSMLRLAAVSRGRLPQAPPTGCGFPLSLSERGLVPSRRAPAAIHMGASLDLEASEQFPQEAQQLLQVTCVMRL